jgi:hypothetical protein
MMTFVKAKAIDVSRSPIQRPRRRRCSVVLSLSVDLEITYMIAKEPRMDNEAEMETSVDVRWMGAI